MSQPQQQPPTPEQVYQNFNQNELNSRQMFEMIYNSYLKLQAQYQKVVADNAQLTEQISNLTKQKEPTKGKK